jgi:hypothetical protein
MQIIATDDEGRSEAIREDQMLKINLNAGAGGQLTSRRSRLLTRVTL